MVHAVHRSIQVYQDFHRQTLSHLQKLEQTCYKLLPQFDQEQVLGMVEQAHRMKAGACYLNLTGFKKLAFHIKGRYMALIDLSSTFERDLLGQLIQMQELFRLCLLSNVSTWKADLRNVVKKMPEIFHSLDQSLSLHPEFTDAFPTQEELEADIQRLLVAIVLIPELARLDMMLKNTPASKLSEILTSQMPRLQTLAKELQLQEIQRSMQISLLEIQARPSHAKSIGTQGLLKWSDLSYQTLTGKLVQQEPSPEIEQTPSSFANACAIHLESALIQCSVAVIEGDEDRLLPTFQNQAQRIADIAMRFEITSLSQTTDAVLQALRYHPDEMRLIGRLAIQDWLRYQLLGLSQRDMAAVPAQTSSTLLDLAREPLNWHEPAATAQDSMLMGLWSQVEMPDGFREFSDEDSQTITVSSDDLETLFLRLQLCQRELEQIPNVPLSLRQSFLDLFHDYHRLGSISLSEVLNRFQPMVDALGLQCYKEVNLQVSGGQITIDRHKSDILYELLMPLVSNAVVHGLEKADERKRLGKHRRGRLMIAAYPQGDDVLLELRDDGQGLNFEVLREWVMRQYDLSAEEGNFLTESEILDYIFKHEYQPSGHSRAEDEFQAHSRIEDVGLGAIQGTLEQLNGSIEVSTVLMQGTTFRILLPKLLVPLPQLHPGGAATPLPQHAVSYSSLSFQDYSLDSLRLQSQTGPELQLDTQDLFLWADATMAFFFECDRIEEYVMPQITEAHRNQHSLTWRDHKVPIFSLQDFLGSASVDESPINDEVILILRTEQQFLALRAPMQHVVSEATLSISPLSQSVAAPRYIYGTTQLEGSSKLVIDVAALIAQQPMPSLFPLPMASESAGQQSDGSDQSLPTQNLSQIMVVDDSRTAREIVAMTLRQGGYDVVLAKDGVDALEQLQSQLAEQNVVDLVISDVAMPRMNGLEFLRQCRQDITLKSLPIAMLSNCDSTTHSDLAIKAGANAYLTKPYEESVFLEEIAKLLNTVPEMLSGA